MLFYKWLHTYAYKTGFLTSLRLFRTKIGFKQRYEWYLDLQKSRARSRYPYIPKEASNLMVINGKTIEVREMQAEFIIANDLELCKLKPYVSWRVKTVTEPALTPERLYESHYAENIVKNFDKGMSESEITSSLYENDFKTDR